MRIFRAWIRDLGWRVVGVEIACLLCTVDVREVSIGSIWKARMIRFVGIKLGYD